MNFFSLIQIELQKIKRSKILLLLVIPVFMMWIPSILNADGIFDTQGIPITPESNFFVQGFMGMVWFMILPRSSSVPYCSGRTNIPIMGS